ncbi:MAG: hypothetical protein H7256_03400 [Bdellovibrio sp.]|nr:hypothetical protein [Bdellovibrio sp.]
MQFQRCTFTLVLINLISLMAQGKGYEKCDIPDKWILSVVKADGGSTIEAGKIPVKVLEKIESGCMDDITDAIFDEKLGYTQVAEAVKKAQDSRKAKK